MKKISKGEKATRNGVLLTISEYDEYIKLKDVITTFRTYKKDYNMTYKSYLM